MTKPLPVEVGDRVKYRPWGERHWDTLDWYVLSISFSTGRILILAGRYCRKWVERNEIRKMPDRKEGA